MSLVVRRKVGESIRIGPADKPLGWIRVDRIFGDKVQLSLQFPRDVKLTRVDEHVPHNALDTLHTGTKP